MPAPPRTPAEFLEILELVWWRLDRALDLEMIEWSAKLGALEALESGCTAIIDHHESPNAIEGSLTVIADACAEVGVRVSTCYGVTDRHGAEGARRGLAENDRYLRAGGRGMVGVHAAFTCTDDTLAAAAELARTHQVGVHIHVAEGPADAGAADRLRRPAADDWLIVHGVHLARRPRPARHRRPQPALQHEQRGRLRGARRGSPTRSRSAPTASVPTCSTSSVSRSSAVREHDVTSTPATAWSWLEHNWSLFPEALNDRVTWSYAPIDPWRLAYTTGVRALDVDVDGETVLADGRPTRVDGDEIRAKAAEQAQRLFARLDEL